MLRLTDGISNGKDSCDVLSVFSVFVQKQESASGFLKPEKFAGAGWSGLYFSGIFTGTSCFFVRIHSICIAEVIAGQVFRYPFHANDCPDAFFAAAYFCADVSPGGAVQ